MLTSVMVSRDTVDLDSPVRRTSSPLVRDTRSARKARSTWRPRSSVMVTGEEGLIANPYSLQKGTHRYTRIPYAC
ncbi:hypothetical protein D3C81_844480 [compost metagenome]